jgi:ubiquinone/menaquinone biosynthesis C-methylase UbiE
MQRAKLDNYVSERGAVAYRADHASKLHRKLSDRLERRILERCFAAIEPVKSILDVPSGHGRMLSLLRSKAPLVVEADYSPSMLRLNAADHGQAAGLYTRCSALALPFADRSFDLVLSIRLSHHLDDLGEREGHVRELCRVAGRAVVFTFFDFHSLKNALRRLRAPFDHKRPKHTLSRERVGELARDCGFALRSASPLSRLGSGHVYALLARA